MAVFLFTALIVACSLLLYKWSSLRGAEANIALSGSTFPVVDHADVAKAAGQTARTGAITAISSAAAASGDTPAYRVKRGDTLWGIARRFGVALSALRSINPDASAYLRIGEMLNIPGSSAVALANIALAAGNTPVADVPFFSQFRDISSPTWQGVGCGITSLAMIIDYYQPSAVSVNDLLKQGIAAGAYDNRSGWIFSGLIGLSEQYGLAGSTYDLSRFGAQTAVARLDSLLARGPLIVSVHNKFDPADSLPHMVVVDGIRNGVAYYNDPAAKTGNKEISVAGLLNGWEGDVIALRPQDTTSSQLSLQ